MATTFKGIIAKAGYSGTINGLSGGVPIAYWRVSNTEVFPDEKGAHPGAWTTLGGVLVPGLAQGAGGAVDFIGVAAAEVPHHASLALPAFSLSFWFKGAELVPGDPRLVVLVSKENATTVSEGDFRIMLDEEGSLRFRMRDSTTAPHPMDSQQNSAPLGVPHHVCFRADNTGFDAYLNGQYVGKITAYTGAWTANDEPLRFGINAIDDIGANVVLDEIALFDRVLDESEVLQLAQHGEIAPTAVDDVVNVPESATTAIDATGNDSFVGAKANLTVAIVSQPAGGDSVAVDGNNDLAYTAGAVTEDTARSFTYRITDVNGTSNTATVNVTVTDSVTVADAPFFGLAIGDDALNVGPTNTNLRFSDPDNANSEFFWAERTGTVTHFRNQWRLDSSRPGAYSDGNGGTYTVQIRPADPATKKPIPGSNPICQFTGYQPGNAQTSGKWVLHQFTLQGQLTAKQPYCLVYLNTASNPGDNYVSSNLSLHSRGTFPDPPAGGWTPIVVPDVGLPHKPYTTWVRFPPNLQTSNNGMNHWNIRYADGQWTGNSNPATISPPRSHVIQGSNMVRHRFRPWRNHTVDGVWINVQRRNASGGSLIVTLENGPASLSSGNGTLPVIEEVSIAASELLDIGTDSELEIGHQAYWSFIAFSEERSLVSGNIYSIRLSASGGLDGRVNAGFRKQGAQSDDWSQAFDDFDAHEAGQTLSWSAWEYSLGLQITSNGGSSWSFPTGNNRQTCPLLIRCVP